MAKHTHQKRIEAVVEAVGLPDETRRALETAELLAKRVLLLDALARDLFPAAIEAGIGWRLARRARYILRMPRKAEVVSRPDLPKTHREGELAAGDVWAIGDRLFKVRKLTRREATFKVIGAASTVDRDKARARAHLRGVLSAILWLALLGALVFALTGCGSGVSLDLGQPCEAADGPACSMEVPGVVEDPFPAVIDCYGGRWALAELCLEVCHWRPEEGIAWCDTDDPPEGL